MCLCDEKKRLPSVFKVNDSGHYEIQQSLTRNDIIQAGITLLGDNFLRTVCLNTPTSSQAFIEALLGATTEDTFAAAYLDDQYRVVAYERFESLINYLPVIIKTGLNCSAYYIVVGHRHLAKTPDVSEMITSQDCRIVPMLDRNCRELGLFLLDYIVCTYSATSYFELTESSPFKNRYPGYENAPEPEVE